MCVEQFYFVLYMSNLTLPNLSQFELRGSKLECTVSALVTNSSSFFYNSQNNKCVVHPTKIFSIQGLTPNVGFDYYVKDGPGCGPPPEPPGHTLIDVVTESTNNFTAVYQCDDMYVHRPITTSCIGFPSTWSAATPCIEYSSCATIKNCNSSYTTDGEYWHYPSVLGSHGVRLYCHGMNTASPKTYLTLSNSNVFDYPAGRCSSNSGCQVFSHSHNVPGKTGFNKVRINTTDMSTINEDYTFTTQFWGSKIYYGQSQCCSVHNTAMCLRGSGKLDVTDTGLIVSNTTTWKKSGWIPHFTITRTDHVINLRGDGGCGGAVPENQIRFLVDPNFTPELTTATRAVCDLLGV